MDGDANLSSGEAVGASDREPRRHAFFVWPSVTVLAAILLMLGWPVFQDTRTVFLENSSKHNFHEICLLLEEYAAANDGRYPEDLYGIRAQDVGHWPINPFTGELVEIIHPEDHTHIPGAVVYIPICVSPETSPDISGYWLLGYGKHKTRGAEGHNAWVSEFWPGNEINWDYVFWHFGAGIQPHIMD